MSTMHTNKLIASSTSPVPFTTDRASLRGLPGIFLFKPNPQLLASMTEPVHNRGIKPMRHPPIQLPRKLSAVLNIFQVLYDEGLDIRLIHLIQGIKHQALAFCVSMFLPLAKLLDGLINIFSDHSSIREDHTVLVIAVHAKNPPMSSQRRSWLFKDQINKQFFIFEAETNGLTNRPAIFKFVVQVFGRFYRQDHFWSARANKVYRVIKGAFKLLYSHKVIVEGYGMLSKSWLSVIHSVSNNFFCLLGHGLGESCCSLESISAFMNSFEIGHFCGLIVSLPKEVYEILSKVVAFIEEGFKGFCLGLVQVREENAGRASHSWGLELGMGFNHNL